MRVHVGASRAKPTPTTATAQSIFLNSMPRPGGSVPASMKITCGLMGMRPFIFHWTLQMMSVINEFHVPEGTMAAQDACVPITPGREQKCTPFSKCTQFLKLQNENKALNISTWRLWQF
jgi:hypothetical protein